MSSFTILGDTSGSVTLQANTVSGATVLSLPTSSGTILTTAIKLGLGITGETWHNVAGSRSFNTVYTNSNSYPIAVSISAGAASYGTPGAIYVSSNGGSSYVTVAIMGTNPNASSTFNFAIVPPGNLYYATGLGSISNWAELY